ncbi:unnamed protein product [Parajaminaea phylloscopi]
MSRSTIANIDAPAPRSPRGDSPVRSRPSGLTMTVPSIQIREDRSVSPAPKPLLVSALEARRQSLSPSNGCDNAPSKMGPPATPPRFDDRRACLESPREALSSHRIASAPMSEESTSMRDSLSPQDTPSSKRSQRDGQETLGSPITKRLRRLSGDSSGSSGSDARSASPTSADEADGRTRKRSPNASPRTTMHYSPQLSAAKSGEEFRRELIQSFARKGYGGMTAHEREGLFMSTLAAQYTAFSEQLDYAQRRSDAMKHRALVYLGQRDEALSRLSQTQELLAVANNRVDITSGPAGCAPRSGDRSGAHPSMTNMEWWPARTLSAPFLPGSQWSAGPGTEQYSHEAPISRPTTRDSAPKASATPPTSTHTQEGEAVSAAAKGRRRTQSAEVRQQQQRASFRRERLSSFGGVEALKAVTLSPLLAASSSPDPACEPKSVVSCGPMAVSLTVSTAGSLSPSAAKRAVRARTPSGASSISSETVSSASDSPAWASPSALVASRRPTTALPGVGAILTQAN